MLPGDVRDFATNHRKPLGDREHRVLRRVGRHADDQLVDEVRAAANDVEVPQVIGSKVPG